MRGIDLREVKVTVQIGNNTSTYEDIYISARGTKYANALQNECELTIKNLNRHDRDYIMTETSPYNINYVSKTVKIEAGRKSYGLSTIYFGNIVSSDITQPPDIGIVLKCLTGNYLKGTIITRNQPYQIPLSQVAKQVANDLQVALQFQATDKNLPNFSFSGAALMQVNHLAQAGGINVYIDDGTLIVKNAGSPLNDRIVNINANTGMVGIPELTEWGVRVTFLLNNDATIGGSMVLQSQFNPSLNGQYVIYKLGFDIANREQPFYYIAEASKIR